MALKLQEMLRFQREPSKEVLSEFLLFPLFCCFLRRVDLELRERGLRQFDASRSFVSVPEML